MISSPLKSSSWLKTEVKKFGSSSFGAYKVAKVILLSICGQIAYYETSLGINVSFWKLIAEIIVKRYGYTCFVAWTTTEQCLITPFSSPIMYTVFRTMGLLDKIHRHIFAFEPVENFPSLKPVSLSPIVDRSYSKIHFSHIFCWWKLDRGRLSALLKETCTVGFDTSSRAATFRGGSWGSCTASGFGFRHDNNLSWI